MSDNMDNVQSRKWQITINNPLDHGFSHDAIIQLMSKVRGVGLYWCMCDEEGDECATLHTHVFLYRSKSAFTARQIDNLFPKMHRQVCYGSPAENRAYILKDGDKFNKDADGHYNYTDSSGKKHVGINYSDTFFESGECPEEHQGKSKDVELIVELIKDGVSTSKIIDSIPSAFRVVDKVERTRTVFRDEEFRSKWRDLEVSYIFGKTGAGKTRTVMEKYGYVNCYRVTDYDHPFDSYDGQDVIIFEEFRSGLKLGDMLNYLDGYPVVLPCRYFNRQACFTKVFLISNWPPDSQYHGSDPSSRDAFFRRIKKVVRYGDSGIEEWSSVQEYEDEHDMPF